MRQYKASQGLHTRRHTLLMWQLQQQGQQQTDGFAAARAKQLAQRGEKEAPAEWLGQVSQPVKDVMSAMQEMASVGAQANVHKDSSHSSLKQSMTPDALLACGEWWVAMQYSSFMLLFSTPACTSHGLVYLSGMLSAVTVCTQRDHALTAATMLVYEHASANLYVASDHGCMPEYCFLWCRAAC